jgi:hypothetical protein
MKPNNKKEILKAILYIKNKKPNKYRKVKSSDLMFKSNNHFKK